ncbi:hypothetical protein IMG5_093030 [Ichthyophthirius multifiliis]|uniref:Ion transport domain-containing protein n=1 Tax=Ichthyophthirius multifiliis TaxID=5932 RepID=G0QRH3_ICHMU|nr:hypothetical protein IMG5_093030 [Ichthyophthirius multifiliis]EGR32179.1 hypothetical protein IMG5_093030 [Ichthyophthirius multifiliis]|eukprot:XP_004035665.1 hypothetical protein IMG5_093030 [Ichthyophthirius multifiliis]
MFQKIIICVPIVIKLSVIIVIIFYIYSAIGVELFTTLKPIEYNKTGLYGFSMCSTKYVQKNKIKDSTQCNYADFNSFLGSMLVLLQVCTAAGWSNIVFDYGYKFDSLLNSILFFNSFHFIAVFMLSLIGGIIWEVFTVVEKIMEDIQAVEEQQELLNSIEQQQQLLQSINFETNQNKYIDIVYTIAFLEKKNYNYLRRFSIQKKGEDDDSEESDESEESKESKEQLQFKYHLGIEREFKLQQQQTMLNKMTQNKNNQNNQNQCETPKDLFIKKKK